jgi:ribosome biogenesis GTPase / thiamine phosphate phosphatase
MKGLVMKSTGSWYEVVTEDQRHYSCRTKGKLRLEGSKETNPVAVGDWVTIEMEGKNGVISAILERKNHMLRQAVKKSGHSHVLAANLDQVVLIATLKQPRTSTGFIDRFLVSAEAFRIPQVLIFNKTDLLTPKENTEQEDFLLLYNRLGVHTVGLCAPADDLGFLNSILSNKVTLMAGHSGVGKSTLLNRLSPGTFQSTGKISEFSSKGIHTTTFAEMFQVSPDTFLIDTPGVKEWGLVDMNQQEISDYFPEMRDRRLNCKFGSRCLHVNEPKCAIMEAVQKEEIARSRYENYLSMVIGDDNRK